MQSLIIIRGPSGSGKSTYANRHFSGYKHFEADMYFYKKTDSSSGVSDFEYQFDASKLGEAHNWCYDQCVQALRNGSSVVVSNTFTKLWEMERYILLAKELEIQLKVYRMVSQFQNDHGVPEKTVQLMRQRMENYPNELIVDLTKKL